MNMMGPFQIDDGNGVVVDGNQAMDTVCLDQSSGSPLCTSTMYQFFNINNNVSGLSPTSCGVIGLAPAGDNSIAMDLFSQSAIKSPIVTFATDGLYFGDKPEITTE